MHPNFLPARRVAGVHFCEKLNQESNAERRSDSALHAGMEEVLDAIAIVGVDGSELATYTIFQRLRAT